VAAVQLMGMTHYPPFGWADEHMAAIMGAMLADPSVPPEELDPASWPVPMQAEWGDDRGTTGAAGHRAELIAGFDRVRSELDEFDPDVVLVWGDDQYENFKEDLIPPYSILAYPDRVIRPYETRAASAYPSYWDEPQDLEVTVKGRPDIAKWLTERLIDSNFDVAYAYEPLHDEHLPHAFLNTVLFLDHRRTGFPWPVVCMPINCYGRKVIAARGGAKPFGTPMDLDPPSPPPSRMMDLGGAVMRELLASPWKVAVIASSSWSHAFLTDHTWRLRPDTEADLRLYEAMVDGAYDQWEKVSTADIEQAGQQEILNWFALVGAAREIGTPPQWSTFVETWVFNSNKVFASWAPTG
jgi:hypothetical protein